MNKDEICRLVKKALFAARKAAELVFVGPLIDEPTKIRKESGAVDFALLGLSYIQTARVLVATTGEPDPLFDQSQRNMMRLCASLLTAIPRTTLASG